ncbi:hypothetical protein Zmor_009195 [Zophobas morio]|uniref:BHLH domain-containing protein n=1 Tax=Zophobas morio TaxID=2755281 RepID=A0AA38INU9_9CUCU|nr:hypothetical protein Zmor_009195 [Zophobas morio]
MANPVSACMYSEWMVGGEEYRVSAPGDDGTKDGDTKEDKKRGYKHVPHREKPAQVVARRNARERRRVQAVNSAFARLRKVVPVENARLGFGGVGGRWGYWWRWFLFGA